MPLAKTCLPEQRRNRPHPGLDISAVAGTPILASAAGRVTFAGTRTGYGKTVEIDHGYGISSLYAHLSRLDVQLGDVVERGQLVGAMGTTGRSTGPHLHFEVRLDGNAVDPMDYLPRVKR